MVCVGIGVSPREEGWRSPRHARNNNNTYVGVEQQALEGGGGRVRLRCGGGGREGGGQGEGREVEEAGHGCWSCLLGGLLLLCGLVMWRWEWVHMVSRWGLCAARMWFMCRRGACAWIIRQASKDWVEARTQHTRRDVMLPYVADEGIQPKQHAQQHLDRRA